MKYRKVYDTRAKAEVRVHYREAEGPVRLEFPLVYARQAFNLPAVLQALLTTTRPPLDPGEQALSRSLHKVSQSGVTLRRLREGDQVALDLGSGRGVITWELAGSDWHTK